MTEKEYSFPSGKVICCFNDSFEDFVSSLNRRVVILTDSNLYHFYQSRFSPHTTIVIPPGEPSKNQQTVDFVIMKLLEKNIDNNSLLIGIGGGVVTDIAGYVASVYKRGMPLAFLPTSLLAMVDASIGGKNGIDVHSYKNMVGTIYQPQYVVYDYSLMESLPQVEWVNGFAEIIKHACISDSEMFDQLEYYGPHELVQNKQLLYELIGKNVQIKMDIVTNDEHEKHDRKLLNFGHTIGHAIEKLHNLPHGHSISIGMVAACALSEKINHLHFNDANRVAKLLMKFHLPIDIETDCNQVFEMMKQDKKRSGNMMHFVLLDKIGHAHAEPVSMESLSHYLPDLL